MNKVIVLFALLCLLTQHAFGLTSWLEIKPSYFFFPQYPMNEIYDKGGFEIQVSGSVPFRNYFDFYSSIGYRRVCGRALNSCEKTNLSVIPVDIGIKPIFNFCEKFYYFFAIWPRFFFFQQNNNSPYVNSEINDCGIGVFANTGLNVLIKDSFLFGIFGEYSFEKKKIYPIGLNVYSNSSAQLGGLAFGLSFGYAF